MAKENYVSLLGPLCELPRMDAKKENAKFKLNTIRRNDKYDTPVVRVLDTEIIKKLETFEVGDFILVKGIISTRDIKFKSQCPTCGEVNETRGTTTEVLAIDVLNLGKNYELDKLKEFSNIVRILGTLCREPVLSSTNSQTKVPLCKYQIAANRKLKVLKESETYSDYPWVNSFGRQAEQDALHLTTGSQVYIDGGVQTRSLKRDCKCASCNAAYKTPGDIIIEIVPHSVEYLNNCKFDD